MKKLLLVILLSAGSAHIMFAQTSGYFYYNGNYDGPLPTKTDLVFNNPRPGKAKVNFHFTGLKNSARVTLELLDIKQLDYLPNLDSILSVAKANLVAIADSLKEDGINRRVDYVTIANRAQIRIVNHDNLPKQYMINKGELSELKVEQDTLRIRAFTKLTDTGSLQYPSKKKKAYLYNQPFFITIEVNNITDINNFDPTILQQCINRLKQDLTTEYVAKANPSDAYTAVFNMQTNKMVNPTKIKWLKYTADGYYDEFVPNIYAGMEFARGNFIPSISVGLRYTISGGRFGTKRLYAMWEPHFLFSRDASNKLVTDRNDFITLRYLIIWKGKKEGFDFVDNVSLGYLVNRNGNWFEPGTWKLGIPGVRSGWLQLEPEFFFNGFLKNFSPSLRLTIHFE